MDDLRADDPRWIGTYRLLGRLGTGGMGRVYLARSERGRTVAVKLVRAELAEQDEFRTRFRREVRAARRVGGRWTAPVLDADTEALIPWVATGYVAGPSLQQVVAKDHGPLPEASVRVLASGLAHALADIHAAGLVHRDLKPSNVMITIDGPRVIDFGIARALETVADDGEGTEGPVTYTGAMVGSPAFMSPEQVRGDRVTPACDIFCLGSVLAYAATGLQPFGAASSGVHAQMFRIVQEPPDLDAVPGGLRDLVAACLVKDPLERPSLEEVQERITAAGGGADPAAGGGSAAEPWLPGAIVARLGRQAVRLLELEAAETGSLPVVSAADAPSARTRVQMAGIPVDASQVPVIPEPRSEPQPHPAPAPAAAQPAGSASAHGRDATAAGPQGPVYATGAATGPQGAAVPYPAQAPPAGPHIPPAGSSAPSGPSAATGTEPARRRRRGTLIAVVALLAVIAGGTTAVVALRAGEHDGRGRTQPGSAPPKSSPSGQGTTAPATPSTSAPSGPAGTAAAPADLVGTWHAAFDSGQGENDRTLTIRPDGSVVLTGSSTSGSGYSCQWSMHVTSAGPPTELSPSALTSGQPAGACLPGERTSLTLVDPTHLRRDNLDSGKAPLTYEKTG